MTILRGTALVAAPPSAVLAAVTEIDRVRSALAPLGFMIGTTPGAQLAIGDVVTVRWRAFRALRLVAPLRLAAVDDTEAVLLDGDRLRVSVSTTVTRAGTLVTAMLRWRLPGGVFGRRTALRVLAALLATVRSRAEELVRARVVVGAVIVDGDTVLAAQRDRPAGLAGRWEFPGGQVEDGEDERAALVRECREELGVDAVVADRIGPDLPLPGGAVLRLYTATITGEPVAREHRALRRVRAGELAGLDWLDADRAVLPQVRALLAGNPARSVS